MKYLSLLILMAGAFFLSSCEEAAVDPSTVISYDFLIQDVNGNNTTTFAFGDNVRMVFLKQNLTQATLHLTGSNPSVVFKVYQNSVLVGSSTDSVTYTGVILDEILNPLTINNTSYHWFDYNAHQPLPPGTYTAEVTYSSYISDYGLTTGYTNRMDFTVQ